MMMRPSKTPAAPNLDSSDDEVDEDEGGDERQPSDDELANTPCNIVQQPKENEDSPDDGGGKQPAAMQPGIGHIPSSAEQLSHEGNVASRASSLGGHAEDEDEGDVGDKDGGDDEERGDEGIT